MSTSEKPLHIDIPVRLTDLRIAFSIADLAFEGDLPASIFHLQLITNDSADWKAKAQVIAVFHTNAGHVTLNDDSYNAERKTTRLPHLVSSAQREVSCTGCRSTSSRLR
jgi:hypothetical protein